MKQSRGIYVVDVEQFGELHTSTWKDVDTLEVHQFVIHELRNDFHVYIVFLSKVVKVITYNGKHYDYHILHRIIERRDKYSTMRAKFICQELTQLSLAIIKDGASPRYDQEYFDNVDLMKIWHYDNDARRTSLKVLQCSMNYHNVEEFDFNMPIKTMKDINKVLSYNFNDVDSSYMFFKSSLDKIRLRQLLHSQFNFSCMNMSDASVGERLTLHFYKEETGISEYELRKRKDAYMYPRMLYTRDIIFDYIKFNKPNHKALLHAVKTSTLDATEKLKLNAHSFQNLKHYNIFVEVKGKKERKETIFMVSKGLEYYIGAGGIHASRVGKFETSATHSLIDVDVSSLYPNIAIQNNLYPVLLGQAFVKIYKEKIVDVRLQSKSLLGKYKKKLIELTPEEVLYHNTVSDGFKLSANAVYGKSNDKFSVMFDPTYTASTTLNGQLMILMLCEKLEDLGQIVQVNTDGVTILLPNERREEFQAICDEWSVMSKLELEHEYYEKFFIRDVNNYIALKADGKTKEKGAFEVDKRIGSEPSYHKDNSFRIIPYAVREYLTKGTSVTETLSKHDVIYDFLGREKFNSDFVGYVQKIEQNNGGFNLFGETTTKIVVPKVFRYYISNDGYPLLKESKKFGTVNGINVGYVVTGCNEVKDENAKNYNNIDYDYYYNECQKLINSVL